MESETVTFIVGAGRSGTTLVYKGLCMHPDVGWISNYMVKRPGAKRLAGLNRIVRGWPRLRDRAWFGPQGDAFLRDRQLLLRAVPTPVEGEALYTHCGIPRFPTTHWQISQSQTMCLRNMFSRIRSAQGAKILVTKRTANNRRMRQLLVAFPRANFVHVIRDGRSVAWSLLGAPWWKNHKLWWHDERTPAQCEQAGEDALELAAKNWVQEMDEIEQGLAAVPDEQIKEIRYEDLMEKTRATWTEIARFIGLDFIGPWLEPTMRIPMYDTTRRWVAETDHIRVDALHKLQGSKLARYGYVP